MVNFGIAPLAFVDNHGYAGVAQGDVLEIEMKDLKKDICVKNVTKGLEIQVELYLSDREKNMLKAGGKLAAIKAKHIIK